jgi:hypothetical protein
MIEKKHCVREHFNICHAIFFKSDILKFPENLIHYLIPIGTGLFLFSILSIIMPDQANLITAIIIGIISVPLGIYLDGKFFSVP